VQTIGELEKNRFRQTQKSIRTRIARAVSSMNALRVFLGESTVNIDKLIDGGKIVIANFRQGLLSEDASQILGKFLIALVQTNIKKRPIGNKHKPTFLFLDEIQDFVTSKITNILAKDRQRGLHMILAHQHLGQIEDTNIRSGIIANTGVKVISKADPKSQSVMSKQMHFSDKEFEKLKRYHFFVHDSSQYDFKTKQVKASSKYVSNNSAFYMSNAQLEEYFKWLVHESGYYKKLEKDILPKPTPTKKVTKKASESPSNSQYEDPFA